jgi:hypothetical protein
MNNKHKLSGVFIFIGSVILIGIIICCGSLFYYEPTREVNELIRYPDAVLPSPYDKTVSEVKELQNSRHGYDTSENVHKAYDIIIDAPSESALEQYQRETLELTRKKAEKHIIGFEMLDNMRKRYEEATSSGDPHKISKVCEEMNVELNAKIPSLSDADIQLSFYKLAHDIKDHLKRIRGEIAKYEREYSFTYDEIKVEFINKVAEKELSEARSYYNKGKGRWWDDQYVIAQGFPHVNRVMNTSLVSAPHRSEAEKLRGLIVGELFSNYI